MNIVISKTGGKIWRRLKRNDFAVILLTTLLCFSLIKISYHALVFEGFSSPVWPVTGINLALILLIGYRIWPSILIASFLSYINFDLMLNGAAFADSVSPQIYFIPFNNVLHAISGAWILKRLKIFPSDYSSPKEILSFYLIAGPVPALVGSLFGNSCSIYFGLINSDELIWEFWRWWIADIGSVYIFTTITLALFHFPKNRKFVVAAVTFIAFTIAYTTYIAGQRWDQDRLNFLFEQRIANLEDTLVGSNANYQSILNVMNGVANNPDGFSRESFRTMAQSILPQNPHINNVNWNEIVLKEDLQKFKNDYKREYDLDLEIYEMQNGVRVPIETRDKYIFAKYFVAPRYEGDEIMFDLLIDNDRREAFEYSRQNKTIATTAPIRTPDQIDRTILPLYLANFRDGEVVGYSTVVINLETMIAEILNSPYSKDMDISISDITDPNQPVTFFQSSDQIENQDDDILLNISMFNRVWQLNVHKNQSFYDEERSEQPIIIGFAGMIISSLIAIGIMIITGQGIFLETKVRERTKELEKASNAKSEFMANMSHDLRTPLNAIIGFSEIMKKQLFGKVGIKQYEGYISDIHKSSEFLLELINDILDLSTLEANKRTLEKENLNLNNLIKDNLRTLSPLTSRKDQNLNYQYDETTPMLFGDKKAINQILINLISNAIKFTPDFGDIDVKVYPTEEYITIDITDTGEGIAKENIELILKPFSRVKNDPLVSQEGTGLGLAIVSSLIKLHDGHLQIESELGQGTTVSVKLPI